jgi:flagellar hook-associated protein 1 FlgK
MNVTAHNISNADIPGFSRQVAVARAGNPLSLNDGRGMYGTGSQVTGINQIRDRFLDNKFWGQRAILGQFEVKHIQLNFIETVFNELPGVGVMNAFQTFFRGMQDLTTGAQEPTFRTGVITAAETLTEMVRMNAQALQRQQSDINREVNDVVTTINSLGSQIAALNRQINMFEVDGSNANDLRDQRALLIDNLSQFVNVQVEERDMSRPGVPNDRQTTVMINGVDFVNHDRIERLRVIPRTAEERRNEMDIDGLYDIGIGTTRFNIYSPTLGGQLRGLIDVRDGNNGFPTMFVVYERDADGNYVLDASDNRIPTGHNATYGTGDRINTSRFKGIPFYMNQLNELVRTFSSAINEGRNAQGELIGGTTGHIFGYDGDGRNLSTMFFTFQNAQLGSTVPLGQYAEVSHLRRWIIEAPTDSTFNQDVLIGLTANEARALLPAGYSIAEDASGNPLFRLDMSGLNALNFAVNPDLLRDPTFLAASTNANIGAANNDVIMGFNVINNDRGLFREGRLIDFIIATSNHLAIDTRQARNFRESYIEISMQTHNHRLSIKGVDTNEEMMNLIRFQTMFTAASRLVNVLDSIYDTLINRLGNM